MLITKSVDVKATGSMIKKYGCKNHEIISIPIEDLSIGSHSIIECSCDYCGIILSMEYRSYLKRNVIINKSSCKQCSPIKQKESNLLLHGVEYPSKLNWVKDKIKETNLERYGVENAGWTKESQEKIKKTNLERYGVENAGWTKESQEKIKKTNLERYGVENPFKSEEIKEKIKETNLEKYGVEYPSQCQEVKDKIVESNLRIYGVSFSQTLDIIKDKVKQTNLERHGVEYPSQLEYFRDKAKKTNLEKHGVEYPSQLEWVKDKVKETNLEKFGTEHYLQSDIYKKIKSENGPYGYKEHNGYYYQSKYELDYCERSNINLSNEIPSIKYFFRNKNHTYYPDFYYEKYNLIIEIKSTYWYNYLSEMNQEKEKQTKLEGYNYILIMDKNYTDFTEKYLN